jgi:pyruvate formate lyase activating enzyme
LYITAMRTTGLIFDLRRFSIHDGPGIRTTVFLKGCPLDCWWCHNPESRSPEREPFFRAQRCIRCGACADTCPEGALTREDPGLCRACGTCAEACYAGAREMVGREMSVAEVLEEVLKDRAFYEESRGGVSASGGEPLMQAEFLLELLKACKREGLHTALDTNGYAPWEKIEPLLPQVDLFLYDLKLMDEERHRQFTGASNQLILENLGRLSGRGASLHLRIPVIPEVNDDEENLLATAALARSLPGVKRVDLLPYHQAALAKYENLGQSYRLTGTRPPAEERMLELARMFLDSGLSVHLGG